MKKLLSVILALTMVFSMVPISALACEPEEAPIGAAVQETVLPEENSPAEVFDLFSDAGTTSPEQPEMVDEYMLEYERMLEESRKVDRFIIKPSAAMARSTMRTLGGEAIVAREALSTDVAQPAEYVIVILEEKVHPEEFIAQVGNSVEFIQPDYELEISAVATADDDMQVPKAVFDREANLAAAHQISTGSGVTIALLDTGVDMTHPDLAGHFADAWNFVDNSSSVTATGTSMGEAHGTRIAGIIASVAPDATIMPLQVFKYGKAYTSDIVAAIQYAEAHGARIVNCSWGSSVDNQMLQEVIEASDMLFVTAAGNSRSNLDENPVYPASYDFDNVINVASVNNDGGMSYFSNYGESVDIAAWGRDVVSTMPGGGYSDMMGTSISAGFVSGAAALAHGNGAAILEVKDMLKSSADKLDILDRKTDNGNMLNYFNAVSGIEPTETTVVNAADDFDTFKEPTPEESWELFSSVKNTAISAGGGHFLVLKEDGTVWAWGANSYGQLGDGTLTQSDIPKQVAGIYNAVAISAGNNFSMVLQENGTVWTWGKNEHGELADGTTVNKLVATQVYQGEQIDSISAGTDFSMVLKSDKTVWVSGINSYGQHGDGTYKDNTEPTQTLLSNVEYIAAGDGHCLAILQDMTVWAWGYNIYGQAGHINGTEKSTPQKINALPNAVSVKGGRWFSVAIDKDGAVWTWGYGGYSILGGRPGQSQDQHNPVAGVVPGLENATQISAGKNHCLLLKNDGTVWAWGNNSGGELGNGTKLPQIYPAQVKGPNNMGFLENIVAVAADGTQSFAIGKDGLIWAWGASKTTPTLVGGDVNKVPGRIACVVNPEPITVPPHTTASDLVKLLPKSLLVTQYTGTETDVLKTLPIAWDIKNYTPSSTDRYQNVAGKVLLEDGMSNPLNIVAIAQVKVTGQEQIGTLTSKRNVSVIAGDNFYLALKENGTVWGWGKSDDGQLGEGTFTYGQGPTQIRIKDVVALATGSTSVLALKSDGSVWAWGTLERTTYSDGTRKKLVPTQIPQLSDIIAIASGKMHRLALKNDGTVWAWGGNSQGQLGDETTENRIEPVQIDLSGIKAISCGGVYSYALKEDGTVWAWGSNSEGQLGVSGTNSRLTPCKIPTIHDIVSIPISKESHTMAIQEDGTVWAWGYNKYEQLGYPTFANNPQFEPKQVPELSNVKKLSLGVYHTIAIKQDCTSWSWGYNNSGQLGDGGNYVQRKPVQIVGEGGIGHFENVVDVSAGYYSTLAVTEDGRVWGFGSNSNWYLGIGTNNSVSSPTLIQGGVNEFNYEITSITAIPTIEVPYDTAMKDIPLPNTILVTLDGIVEHFVDVIWSENNFSYDPQKTNEIQTLFGDVQLEDGLINSNRYMAKISVQVKGKPVISVGDLAPLSVNYGTLGTSVQSQLELEHPTVTVTLEDESTKVLPVAWDVSGSDYDGTTPNTHTIYGDLDLTGEPVTNPDGLRAQIEVVVSPRPGNKITSILPVQQDIGQNIWLAPTDKVNTFGVPTMAALPENVTVQLGSGDMVQLPVVWDKSGYDPALVGKQTLTGEVVIAEGSEITNPDGLRASLEITVLPKEYEVWDASPKEITLEVLPGTTVAQLNKKLKAEGKAELSVQAIDLSNDFEVITFCGLTLAEEDCAGYSKDVPGVYALTARIPSNFTPLAEDIPGPIVINVTVLEPLVITAVESSRMDAYQSVAPEHLENIPAQVNVTLEGGMVIPVDVEWNWKEYAAAKDTVGNHVVVGTLVNLPSFAKQPSGNEFIPSMVVNTIPVDYVVSGVLSENLFEGDAGLGLDELTAILTPTLTMQITSVTEGITLTTEYQVNVTLEQEKNPDFDFEYADRYILVGTLGLPGNITCPEGELYDEILLQTNPVEVVSVEPVYALTTEGTLFADIESLPTQVSVTLSCVGADGQNKKILIDADWGTGEGYNPFPPDLTDDNSVTMEVTGELANWPQYVNGADVSTTLFVTMTRVFDVVAITPNRFPATGAMEVKLGSSLEDIYNLLDTHSVQLTLENPKGETSTVDVTFTLRAEDNPDYNPMTEGTYTLKAHLPLTEKLLNPDSLGVEIVVKTTKYSITSTKAVRVAGVLSGTPFAEVGLPTLATIARNDGREEDIPVTWNGSAYNPTKIGSQVVRGTLTTPLPVHLENPNNRQPSAVVTIINPAVQILSMTQMTGVPMLMANGWEDDAVPGFVEYRYVAELLHEDGTVTTEIISIFVEAE